MMSNPTEKLPWVVIRTAWKTRETVVKAGKPKVSK